jgi:membrane protein YqaA with SNARE-associated domain
MPILEAISLWLRETLLPYGGFGLMVLAICDSSFLSLPEVNDILLMTFSIANPSRMIEYATLTTTGSIIGCALLYTVGRKGGEPFLRRRFSDERMMRIRGWYQKYGVLAVIIPSLLPPPTPFKIFVLSAGTFGISWPRFLGAVAVGRRRDFLR